MVQTVRSINILPGEKMILIEKPHRLYRIFFGIQVFAPDTEWHETRISFDDPLFNSFYVLNGSARYFSAEGEDIFQGNIWAYNTSDVNLLYSSTEILCEVY